MKIKLFISFCLFSAVLCAWEGDFKLSEEAQKQADFYNKFLQALSLENSQNTQEALALLKELLDQSPDDKNLIQEYCYLALNNKKEEFDSCKTALENIKEKSWQNHTVLGDYYLREGALTAALNEYEKALKLNPENLELAFHYAGILASKDQNAAVDYLANLAQNYPQADSYINIKIAEIYIKNKEEEKAVSALEKAAAQNPKPEMFETLVKIYESKKDNASVYKTYQNMEKYGLADAAVLEKLANFAFFNKDEENAKKYFTALLEADGTNPYAARYFAFEEQKQGRYESALNYLKKARDFEENPALQIKAGYYLSMLSRNSELLNLMENAHKNFAGNVEISYYYALALVDAKDYNKAAKVFEEISQNSPGNEQILFNYATLLYQQKKYKKMVNILQRLLKENPNNAEALNFLGYFLVDRGSKKDLDEGHKLITQALKIAPQEIAYQDSLAWYYFKVGDLTKANEILQSLPDVKDEEIYLHKAEVSYALKDFENAAKNYENVLKINPKNKIASKGLNKSKKEILKKS